MAFRFSLFRLLLLVVLATAATQARAQTNFSLSAGWNLLGNRSAASIEVATTFGDANKIMSVWTWNRAASKWAFYTPSLTGQALTNYANTKGYDVLISIAPKEGFWVNASAANALAGPVANAVTLVASDLQSGWNLLGSADNKTPSELNLGLTNSLNVANKAIITAWAWDAPSTKWRFFAPPLEAQGGTALADYISTKGYLPFTAALSPADGFWLNIGAASGTTAPGTAIGLTITSNVPSVATAGSTYSFAFSASGGTPPYTWDAVTIAPDGNTNGFAINNSTGVFSGTPKYAGRMPLLVSVSDAAYRRVSVQYAFAVSGIGSSKAITNTPPAGVQGSSYQFRFSTSWTNQLGCDPALRFIEGSLPPGLTLNTLSGDLGNPPSASGTPLTSGAYTFTLAASQYSTCTSAPYETNAQTFTVQVSPASTPASPPGASNWVRNVANPILAPAPSGWDDFQISSPAVIKAGGIFLLYYEGEDSATHTRKIGVATSTDGITWTKSPSNPVLSPGAAGSWDALEVRYPVVHFDGTTYRMWYWGKNNTDSTSSQAAAMIGLATSPDGVTWTKRTSPVLGTAYGGSGYIPGTVVQNAGQFLMWYESPFGAIGRATSTDGINWTDSGNVRSTPSFNGKRPSVLLDGTTYRMWFGKTNSLGAGILGGPSVRNSNIGYASSADGVNWTVYTQSPSVCFFCVLPDDPIIPVLVMGSAGSWDRPGVGQPSVLKDGATFKMWYAGGRINLPQFGSLNSSSFISGSIGYAVIP